MSRMPRFIKLCKDLRQQGSDYEQQMAALRAQGCSKIETMEIFVELGGMDLGDAKHLVHNSRAWSDTKQVDEEFEAAIIRGLQDKNGNTARPK